MVELKIPKNGGRNMLKLRHYLSIITLIFFVNEAQATTSSGFDSQGDELPIAVNGNVGIDLYTSGTMPATSSSSPAPNLWIPGNVGIGTTALPQVALDVAGTIKTGNATIGASCATEGAMAYDQAAHAPIYCSQALVWKSNSGSSSVTVYLCPVNCNLPDGSWPSAAWLSCGCQGQLSSANYCYNLTGGPNNYWTYSCASIGKLVTN